MRIVIVWLGICIIVLGAKLQDASAEADAKTVLNELSSQYTQCHAYYQIFRECAKDQIDAKTSQQFYESAEMASQLSIEAGLLAGMTQEAILARTELTMKHLMGEMNKSCVNLSIMLKRYAESCKSLLEDPKSHMERIKRTGK